MSARIRIEADGPTAHDARVYYLPTDGEPVEISNCVTGIDLNMDVREPTTATLHVVLVEGRINAEVDDVILTELKPRKRRFSHVAAFISMLRRGNPLARGG